MRMRPGLRPGPLWGTLQSPQTPSWFSGSRFAAGEGRKGEERVKEEKGRGSVPPLLFLQFNDCSAVIVAATYTRLLDLAHQLVCSSVCRHHADYCAFLTFLEFRTTDEVQ